MAKAGFTTTRPSAKVAGTTRLKRTDSQISSPMIASDSRTTTSHSAGKAMAPAAAMPTTMKPTNDAANMIRDTIRLAPSTRSSSLPRRR
ncbi:hypothetical protein D3C87_1320630 [compost metagenome]